MRGLQGKVILVCGGATGIGAATAGRLAEEGARVLIGDIDLDGAQQTASACGDARALQYDQSDQVSIRSLVEAAVAVHGRLDGLFANAADLQVVFEDRDLLDNEAGLWERTLQVNLTGTAQVIRACLPHLLSAGGGSIVVTSSGASVMGEPERPAYAASKAGVETLCRHIASKWGKQNIRANAVAPGLIVTPGIEAGLGKEVLDTVLKGVRYSRHGKVEDIAATASFLLSDDAEFVNGQVWHVNGGVCFGS